MPLFTNAQHAPSPSGSAIRLLAARRISVPASERPAAITEDPINNRPVARSSWTTSAGTYAPAPTSPRLTERMSGTTIGRSSQDTAVNAPPAYTWVEEPLDGADEGQAPVSGGKLAQLRRRGPERKGKRGGWGRLCLILLLVASIVIGLAVGLGVGLTVGRHHHKDGSSLLSGNSTTAAASTFPLGHYSFNAALRTQNTNCTSNAATWRCPPYIVYNSSDSSSQSSSLEAFYWTISNTSLHYATKSIPVAAYGAPSNLTISSAPGSDPHFTNIPLTYVNSGNTASLRYTFNFSTQYYVIPSASLTVASTGAVCYYNSTTFSGSIYLSMNARYPSATTDVGRGINTQPSGDLSAYVNWPYSVDIEATSPGGDGIPTCYEAATNGQLGDVILTATTSELVSDACVCEWRNY
ncbi:hypothetical protein EJ03DRAFT_327955 [Teratosphaeria nubilosa]|uniref:Tat pathway signal sequence n=1 Tax=Teratosphaeria nubilosa TaxID=161662 RepID=A0A6G1L859_9PEZI|nr:hypothetical protein EJ03DRAFT_327955 [Teratosphaeria nubilosa]